MLAYRNIKPAIVNVMNIALEEKNNLSIKLLEKCIIVTIVAQWEGVFNYDTF